MEIISEELVSITDEKGFRYNLHLLPPNFWEQLRELPRLRAENRVIKEIKDGQAVGQSCRKGSLATWARSHFSHFKLKEQVGNAFISKLESDNLLGKYYVVNLFLTQLPDVILSSFQIEKCVTAISGAIRNGNSEIRNSLIDNFWLLPENWMKNFTDSLKDLIDENSIAGYLPDGTPVLFLAKIEPVVSEEDDIPF